MSLPPRKFKSTGSVEEYRRTREDATADSLHSTRTAVLESRRRASTVRLACSIIKKHLFKYSGETGLLESAYATLVNYTDTKVDLEPILSELQLSKNTFLSSLFIAIRMPSTAPMVRYTILKLIFNIVYPGSVTTYRHLAENSTVPFELCLVLKRPKTFFGFDTPGMYSDMIFKTLTMLVLFLTAASYGGVNKVESVILTSGCVENITQFAMDTGPSRMANGAKILLDKLGIHS